MPTIIISPWTAGGWVFSESSDHTSHLQFLEKITAGHPGHQRPAHRRLPIHPLQPPYLLGVYTRCIVTIVSVPLTLLGLLEREPSHGYDLKRDYDTYFGRGRQLPFGQVYATLGRLARDGKVVAGDTEPGDGPDRKRYAITESGRAEVDAWLAEPVAPEPHLQTVLFAKVTLALMLGKSAEPYLNAQRAAHMHRMHELTRLKQAGGLVDVLLADHALFHLEADLRWIDATSARLNELRTLVNGEESLR